MVDRYHQRVPAKPSVRGLGAIDGLPPEVREAFQAMERTLATYERRFDRLEQQKAPANRAKTLKVIVGMLRDSNRLIPKFAEIVVDKDGSVLKFTSEEAGQEIPILTLGEATTILNQVVVEEDEPVVDTVWNFVSPDGVV